MFSYIVFAWDPRNQRSTAEARSLISRCRSATQGWRPALALDGLHVFHRSTSGDTNDCRLLDAERGVVLGPIFHRPSDETDPGGPRNVVFESAATDRLIRSDGRDLVDSYWGSYVAILRDGDSDTTRVLRSPVGSLPCLTTEINEVRLFFSFFPDCLTLGLRHFSVNWRFIARYLTKVNYTAETGLSEVTEIRCGECMVLSRDSASRSMYWEPLAIARSHVIEDPLRASRALNRIVKACVHAWASEHQVLALRLSGGLDSSIVLGCLKDAPHRPTVVCINRYSAGADGDERDFARLAAEHAGCQLIELPRDPTFRIEDALTAHASAAPSNYLMQLGQGRAEADMARASGATGIFTGTYGDQLFFGPNAQLSVVDYLKRHPLSLNVFKVALSAARLEGRSIWSILAEALPAAFRTEEWDPVAASRPFDNLLDEATVRARQGDAQGETPWYSPLQYVPPGKQFHIHSLSSPDGYYSPFEKPNDPCYVSPLMSQPIVELCLRIPTYLLTSNGWDRELARRSFLQEVPARILRRRSKGGQEEYTTQVFSRNRQFMREIFLGGDLLAQGLLDRKKLSEALSHRPSGVLKGTARMSKYLSIELWLRLCTRESARLVA